MKKELPRIVCIIAGLGAMLGFFFEASFLQTSEQTLVNWGIIVAAFSLGTASINLTSEPEEDTEAPRRLVGKRHPARVSFRNDDSRSRYFFFTRALQVLVCGCDRQQSCCYGLLMCST